MQAKTKNSAVPRAAVEAFYRALADRDMDTLATYLDDDVVWTISGPVDILPFCGQRVGKRRGDEAADAGQSHVSGGPAFRPEHNAR